jgi:hypothetical protein
MKLVRHLTSAGPAYAVLQADGSALEVVGDILGEFRVSDHNVKLGKLLPPVVPVAIFCIGANYRKHIEESAPTAPRTPLLFLKPTSATRDLNDSIEIPVKQASYEVDYLPSAGPAGRAASGSLRPASLCGPVPNSAYPRGTNTGSGPVIGSTSQPPKLSLKSSQSREAGHPTPSL